MPAKSMPPHRSKRRLGAGRPGCHRRHPPDLAAGAKRDPRRPSPRRCRKPAADQRPDPARRRRAAGAGPGRHLLGPPRPRHEHASQGRHTAVSTRTGPVPGRDVPYASGGGSGGGAGPGSGSGSRGNGRGGRRGSGGTPRWFSQCNWAWASATRDLGHHWRGARFEVSPGCPGRGGFGHLLAGRILSAMATRAQARSGSSPRAFAAGCGAGAGRPGRSSPREAAAAPARRDVPPLAMTADMGGKPTAEVQAPLLVVRDKADDRSPSACESPLPAHLPRWLRGIWHQGIGYRGRAGGPADPPTGAGGLLAA
jgi:hypothetical protein